MKKRLFLAVFLLILMAITNKPISAYAKEYTGVIKNISESESETTFTFSFSKLQVYDVTLTDPSGSIHNASSYANEIKISVGSAIKGDYSYLVTSEDDEYTFDVLVTESGRVVASVENSKPTISENVTNLKLFFEDGDLVATWDFAGKVSITITDPSKFNNLVSNEQISENEYRYKVPDGVDRLQFYICPATDVKINGAGLTYTRDVVRSVNADVSFLDTPIVNKDKIPISIDVKEEGLSLKIYNNTYDVGITNHEDNKAIPFIEENLKLGVSSIEIPLSLVDNNIVVCIVDKLGNCVTHSYKYTRDLQAPRIETDKLSLDNTGSYLNYQTSNEILLITGTVSDEINTDKLGNVKSLYINGYPVELDSSGRFSFEEKLNLGENIIELIATDESLNESRLEFSVLMVQKESSNSLFIPLLILTLLVFAGIVFLLIKSKLKPDSNRNADKTKEPLNLKSKKLLQIIKKEQDQEAKKMQEKNIPSKSELLNSKMFEELFSEDHSKETEYEDYDDEEILLSNASKIDDLEIEDESSINLVEPLPKEEEREEATPLEKIEFSKSNPKDKMVPILSVIDNEDYFTEKKESIFARLKKKNDVAADVNELIKKDVTIASKKLKNIETKAKKNIENEIKLEDHDSAIMTRPIKVILESKKGKKFTATSKENLSIKNPLVKIKDFSKEADKSVKNKPSKKLVNKAIKPKEVVSEKANSYRQKNAIISLASCVILVGILLFFFKNVILNAVIMSGSMEPTLQVGQTVIYNQLAYKVKSPQRGDIISFIDEDTSMNISKRVIGIEGDEIAFKDGFVFINGMKADESAYLDPEIETVCSKVFNVPKGCVFVLGDNRNNSIDSRFFDDPYIKVDTIKGKFFGSFPKLW